VVAAAVSRGFATSLGIGAACLMAGLLGVIAVTGRWPTDAPRTHLETGGVLSSSVDRITRIEFSAGEHRAVFIREPQGGWGADRVPVRRAAAGHIDIAVRLLTISAPSRVLSAREYSPDQLAEYGLDPPRFILAVTEAGGNIARVAFGADTPAQNMQYVRVLGRPELYLLPRDVGEEWQLAFDMADRAANLLLPVSIAQVWAIEIVNRGALYRFERDPDGLWFHHVNDHVHLPGGIVHRADPKLASLIEAELAGLDGLPITRIVARQPDAGELDSFGLEHAATIVLLYSRDSAGPVGRIELGNAVAEGGDRYARIQQSGAVVIVPDDAAQRLATLLQLAGTPS
jgi:Domain of unknown function (DUF4340)